MSDNCLCFNPKLSPAAGSEDLPEPISIKVDSIDMFLKSDFWQTLERFISSGICKEGQGEDEVREKKMKILKKALDDYPAYIGGQLPKGLWNISMKYKFERRVEPHFLKSA